MNTNNKRIHPYLIALGLSIVTMLILGAASYFLTDTVASLFIKALVAGMVITFIWAGVIYPEKNKGVMEWIERNFVMVIFLFIMIILTLGVSLSGKALQQRHHPETFFPL
jgi:uncharacterized membrane protein